MSKDFLTYNQQLRKLRDSKHIECGGTSDKIILCRAGYFNLVNGYKKPFTHGKVGDNHLYFGGTTLNEIQALKKFDDELRMTLLRYITQVEEEVRTITGYKFDEVNDKGKIQWFEVSAYNDQYIGQSVMKVISNAFQQVQRSRQSYIQHYTETHKQIPTWILVKTISFSTFIDFLDISKEDVKSSICKLYNIKFSNGDNDYKLLKSSLHWLRKVRNACAHNERVYDICRTGRIITNYFDIFPNSYKRERNQMLFDLLVYFKYYMPDDELEVMVNQIYDLLVELRSSIKSQAFDKVRADMGIKDIEHLKLLLNSPKKIVYNKV